MVTQENANHGHKISLKCLSVKTTLDVMGGKWKPLILYLLQDKTLRFSELARGIEGITQKMLTQQLRELERDALIVRKVYPVVPPKVEYSITDFGKTLIPIFLLMDEWGKKFTKRMGKAL
jgi:DNA-binding HxlR family transcriptional regulator